MSYPTHNSTPPRPWIVHGCDTHCALPCYCGCNSLIIHGYDTFIVLFHVICEYSKSDYPWIWYFYCALLWYPWMWHLLRSSVLSMNITIQIIHGYDSFIVLFHVSINMALAVHNGRCCCCVQWTKMNWTKRRTCCCSMKKSCCSQAPAHCGSWPAVWRGLACQCLLMCPTSSLYVLTSGTRLFGCVCVCACVCVCVCAVPNTCLHACTCRHLPVCMWGRDSGGGGGGEPACVRERW